MRFSIVGCKLSVLNMLVILSLLNGCELFENKHHVKELYGVDSNGEGTARYPNNGKVYTGKIYNTFNDGTIKWEYSFDQGVRHGPAKEYYKNGELYSEVFYQNDSYFGERKIYAKNGQLTHLINYGYDGSIRENRRYDEKTGVLVSIYKYGDDGVPYFGEGRYSNGNKKFKDVYEGKILTRRVSWFFEGQVEKDFKFEKTGERIHQKYFYDNGNPRVVEFFDDDQRHGVYKEFHRNGNIKRVGSFDHGIREGTFKVYYKKGDLRAIANYKDGEILNSKYYNYEGQEIQRIFPW